MLMAVAAARWRRRRCRRGGPRAGGSAPGRTKRCRRHPSPADPPTDGW